MFTEIGVFSHHYVAGLGRHTTFGDFPWTVLSVTAVVIEDSVADLVKNDVNM